MIYALPIGMLSLTLATFFLLARGGFRSFGRLQSALRVVLVLPLIISGVAHFIRTSVFAAMIPPVFPQRELLVVVSGILELTGAVGLLLPRTSRAAATCLAILMIAVFPANVYVADTVISGLPMPGVPIRTGMQMIYIVLVLTAGWGLPKQARSV